MNLNHAVRLICLVMVAAACASCDPSSSNSPSSSDSKPCGSTWTTVDSYGNLKKYSSHMSSSGSCLIENQALTKWEASNFAFTKNNVQCAPVPTFRSRSMVSASNYYSYRDGKVFVSLNAETSVRIST